MRRMTDSRFASPTEPVQGQVTGPTPRPSPSPRRTGDASPPLAVVTGASRGLGRALAVALAREGYDVALAARDAAMLDVTVEEVTRTGRRAFRHVLDLTEWSAVDAWATALAALAPPPRVLVLNAGQYYTGRFHAMPVHEIGGMVTTALFGAMWPVRAFLPAMLAERHGYIILVASAAAAPGRPARPRDVGPSVAYLAAKHGMAAFGRALAQEVQGSGVRVTVLYPGAMATDRPPDDPTPVPGALSLAQVTAAVARLLDPALPWIEELVLSP
jgi:NAD(P)-dependent dehydrogenase (short-subunit alcohol dehydrogenase family)